MRELFSVPGTGWFESTDPEYDYEMIRRIARRSSLGDPEKVELQDFVGLEDDFRNGKYEYRDYYIGFIDGGSRMNRARNAIHDMNSYLRALEYFKDQNGDLGRLSAVRFHQTKNRIDRIEYSRVVAE